MIKIVDSVVAIDGFSSCGKSTLAKELAKELGYRFIDSGAMYRACTLYFLDNGVDINDMYYCSVTWAGQPGDVKATFCRYDDVYPNGMTCQPLN